MTNKDALITQTLVLTAHEADTLKAVLKAEEVSHRIVFAEHGEHVKLDNLSIDDIYCLIGCIGVHTEQLKEELEDNAHFETANMVNMLETVKSKCSMLVQHGMN